MPNQNYSINGKKVQELLSEVSQQAGRHSRFVQRRSKLDGSGFVQTMVLGCLKKAQMSLSELAQTSTRLGVPISAPGLDQRIDEEAVVLLQAVLRASIEQLAGQVRLTAGMLQRFSAVFLTDSTQVALPEALRDCFPGSGGCASAAGIKIQLVFDFLHGVFEALEVGAANQPDQRCRLHVQHTRPGALHLFDLGYYSLPVLAALDRQGAFFVTRLEHQTALFTDEDEPLRLDLLACLRQVPGDRWEVRLRLGRQVHLPVRVLFQRLPPAVVEERRRKAQANARDHGRTLSETYLALLEWQFFITNLPADWLSFDQILLLYRVRWQVELLFKLWKSQAGLEQLGPWRKTRLLVHLYARLIGLCLFSALSAPFRWLPTAELSLPKAFRSLQEKIPAMLRAIQAGWHAFPAVLQRLYAHWQRYDLKTHRCKHPSTLERLFLASP